jgi:hypothetical protein
MRHARRCSRNTCITTVLLVLEVSLSELGYCYGQEAKCSIDTGQCTYNINLAHGGCGGGGGDDDTDIELAPGPAPLRARAVHPDGQQSDYNKVTIMEKKFDVVKDDHEKRLKELENSVLKIMRNAIGPPPPGQFNTGSGGGGSAPNTHRSAGPGETNLLTKLHDEFTRLRTHLKTKSRDLSETQLKLNQTTEAMRDAQEALFRNTEQLLVAEHQVTTLGHERSILKNQVKDKTERLEIMTEELNVSETQRRDLEEQLYTVVRSEANLKEELGYFKYMLNQTVKDLDTLKKNHTELTAKHVRTKQELRRREFELMDCYLGKWIILFYRFSFGTRRIGMSYSVKPRCS